MVKARLMGGGEQTTPTRLIVPTVAETTVCAGQGDGDAVQFCTKNSDVNRHTFRVGLHERNNKVRARQGSAKINNPTEQRPLLIT